MIDGYIDRNRLLQHLNDWWWAVSPNTKEPLFLNGILQKTYKMEIIEECMKAVEAQPTADVVEVVRCHNCEYHGIRDKCPLLNMSPYRDDDRGYCSEGKRLE